MARFQCTGRDRTHHNRSGVQLCRTQPPAESVACWWCQGEGCRSCDGAGWVPLLIEYRAGEES